MFPSISALFGFHNNKSSEVQSKYFSFFFPYLFFFLILLILAALAPRWPRCEVVTPQHMHALSSYCVCFFNGPSPLVLLVCSAHVHLQAADWLVGFPGGEAGGPLGGVGGVGGRAQLPFDSLLQPGLVLAN